MTAYRTYFSTIIALLALAFPAAISAQTVQDNLKEAKQLYINGMYQNAQVLFQKAARQLENQESSSSKDREEAEGYRLLCALKLLQEGAQKQAFSYIRKYPTSSLNSKIRFEAASSYFSKEDYSNALVLMEDLQPSDIEPKERDRYLLEKGICLLEEDRVIEAQNHLMEIAEKSKLYGQAQYYLGYSEYRQNNFKEALEHFVKSDNPNSELMIVDCYFMLKDYQSVCNKASKINEYEGAEKARFARIVSESAYALGLNKDAERYFNIYSEQKELSKTDNFYAAQISYSQGNWRNAAALFEECIKFGDTDSLTQNALYRLARCKIEEKDKVAAADAFHKASEMGFNNQVTEDAFFNYAKLSFDLWGNTDKLYEYLHKFNPSTEKKDETYGYIATRCLEDKNYQDAIKALDMISSPTQADLNNLQKANLFLGADLLNSGKSIPAETYFLKAAGVQNTDVQLGNLARFWLSETMFRQDKFDEALDILKKLQGDSRFRASAEYPLSFFRSGYSRLRNKDIEGAYKDFAKYVSMTDGNGSYSLEAKLRMADCKFMQRDFDASSKLYLAIAESDYSKENLYPAIQYAKVLGLKGNSDKKIDFLKKITAEVYSSSSGYTEALYELGKTQVQVSDNKAAETTFLKMVNNPYDSLYYFKGLIELGMLYTNMGDSQKAKSYYRKAAEQGNSEESQNAIDAYRNICNQEGNPDEFMNWILEYSASGKALPGSEEEKISLLFSSAERVFLAQKYGAAAQAFEKFAADYPDYNTVKVWYYLAVSRSQISDLNGAAQAYSKLVSLSDNLESKTEYAVEEIKMLYENKQYEEVILKVSYYLENLEWKENGKREMTYYLGKSLLGSGQTDSGMEKIREVAENTNGLIGAEAAYLIVKDAFDRGKMAKVENLVFELSEKDIDRYYLAKCYLLLGDSYLEQDDFEQAAAVYESIFKSYEGDPQIKQTAKSKMENAKDLLKKQKK